MAHPLGGTDGLLVYATADVTVCMRKRFRTHLSRVQDNNIVRVAIEVAHTESVDPLITIAAACRMALGSHPSGH